MDMTNQQKAAEEIRCHLVAMRGGAPFLSSSDACLLDSWLTQNVPVSSILFAIEKASEARRKRRSRVPLSLKQAKRHLRKVQEEQEQSPSSLPKTKGGHPLAKLALKLQTPTDTRGNTEQLKGLAVALLALPIEEMDSLYRDALHLFREFLVQEWDRLPSEDRERERASAHLELAGVSEHMDESTIAPLIEEVARDRLRQQYPLLCSKALWNTLKDQPYSPSK